MATLHPSIILQAGKGVTKLLTPDELQEQAMNREVNGIKLQHARQGVADDQAYRQVLQSGASGQEQVSALQKAGLGKQAMEASKFQTEQQKTQYERGKAITDAMKVAADAVMQNPTEQNAISALDEISSRYGIAPNHFDRGKAAIYATRNNPNAIRQLMAGLGAKADEALGKIENVNLGGSLQTQRTSPVTGETQVLSNQARTQSPDSVASVAQSGANNAATIAATVRGQDLRAATAAAATGQKNAPKPIPAAALKMQQEGLDAIGTASSINADLDAINKQISEGKLKFGPMSNLVNRGMNASGLSSEESKNFASFQANMEKLRNESLRLNKGVQTDGDAQRAWNELFSNINDTGVVKQRLEEIKRLNDRAVQLRKLDIDNIRVNYGHDPMDTGAYSRVPPALNGGKPLSDFEQAKVADSEKYPAKPADKAAYDALPSGMTFIAPDGSKRRKP